MVGIAEEANRLHEKKGKFFKLLFPIQYRKMWNIRNKTLAAFLNEHVKDPGLQNVLSSLWGYYGLPPSKLSGFYYAIATGEYLKNGSYYIRDRSQNLSDLLADAIEKHGGKVLYETRAEKITVEGDAVNGVVISDGTNPAGTGGCEQWQRARHFQGNAPESDRPLRLSETA